MKRALGDSASIGDASTVVSPAAWVRSLALVGSLTLVPSVAGAAEFSIVVTDSAGEGFRDEGPADPASTAGGNLGSTLGEQRLNALQHALTTWAALLDSEVTIVVHIAMSALNCSNTSAVLGQAGASSLFSEVPNAPDPNVWYVSALADRIAGEDLDPGSPDIIAEFNSSVDAGPCLGGAGWYYGFDGAPSAGSPDFVAVVLHELAHGLGFTSSVNYGSGQFLAGSPDAFSALLFDLGQGTTWDNLNAGQRATSARHARGLVWSGNAVTSAAPSVLARGNPSVSVQPEVMNFSGAINEINWAAKPMMSAQGELAEPNNPCGPQTGLSGRIVLARAGCPGATRALAAQDNNAAGILIEGQSNITPPGDLFEIGDIPEITIPAIHISPADAAALSAALNSQTLEVSLSTDQQLVGADSEGRLYMNATTPISGGSSVSHFDSLARRPQGAGNQDLLMEPAANIAGSEVDLTIELLRDLGWLSSGCGNGAPDAGEECDDGNRVNDDGCNQDCVLERCGDGIINASEACDAGPDNSDESPDSCRTDCSLPSCGDGVIDSSEQCDDGSANSDTRANACRSDCTNPRCGDSVVDLGEECEPGLATGDCNTECEFVAAPAQDAGAPSPDAGSPGETRDAGASASDAGLQGKPNDAGAAQDAAPRADSGEAPNSSDSPRVDAGFSDAPHDASAPAPALDDEAPEDNEPAEPGDSAPVANPTPTPPTDNDDAAAEPGPQQMQATTLDDSTDCSCRAVGAKDHSAPAGSAGLLLMMLTAARARRRHPARPT